MDTFELIINGIKCDAIKIECNVGMEVRMQIDLVYNESLAMYLIDEMSSEIKNMISVYGIRQKEQVLINCGYLSRLSGEKKDNTISMVLMRLMTDDEIKKMRAMWKREGMTEKPIILNIEGS